jgi:prepilin-type N-terminal cleavage/methylation domain-containing protein
MSSRLRFHRPSARRRPGTLPRRGERGFTLAEIVISLAVLGIIMGPLAMSFISGLRTTKEAERLLGESQSAQQIASLWTRDVQNVEPGGVNSQLACPSTNPSDPPIPEEFLVNFSWGTAASASGPESATWTVVGSGTNARIERRSCAAGEPVATQIVADSFGLSNEDPSTVVRGPVPSQPRQFCPLDTDGVARTCTISVNGRYSYSLSVERRVPDATNAVVPDTPPGAPEITLAEPRRQRVNVGWTTPAPGPGQSAVSGFRVHMYDDPDGEPIATEELSETEFAFLGLTNGNQYWFRVQARNEVGWGPLSPMAGPVVPTDSSPEAPTVTGVTAGDTTVAATWSPNANDGGAAVTSWRIYAYTDGGSEVGSVVVSATGGASESGTIGSLLNGSDYRIRVAGINSLGEGPQSVPSEIVRPYGIPGQASVIEVRSNPDGSIDIDWNEPTTNPPNSTLTNGGRPITGYVIRAATGSPSGPWPSSGLLPETARTYNITGLTVGTTYTFVVETHNARGFSTSPASVPGVSATPPGMPRNVVATTQGTGTIRLTWTPPLSNGGSPITGYVVARTGLPAITLGPSASQYDFTGLASGQSYTFSVLAVNIVGNGPAATANATSIGAPSAVSVGVARQAGNTYPFAVNVTWGAPSNRGGGCITSYEVQYSTDQSTWTSSTLTGSPGPAPACTGEPATSLAWTGITAGAQNRYFRVITTNTAGLTSTSTTVSIAMRQVCTLSVTEDARTSNDSGWGWNDSDNNYGSTGNLEVDSDGDRAYIKFDPRSTGSNCSQFAVPAPLPASAVTYSAAVRVYLFEPSSWCRDHRIFRVTGNWSEGTITYDNDPNWDQGGGQICSNGSAGYRTFSVSNAQVDQQRTGNRYGWVITDIGGNFLSSWADYRSREGNSTQGARLDVEFY